MCVLCAGGSSVDLTLGTVGTGTHHIPTTPNHITRESRDKEETIDETHNACYFMERESVELSVTLGTMGHYLSMQLFQQFYFFHLSFEV